MGRADMRPYVIGLTGSIGCGKSHIRETLEELGALPEESLADLPPFRAQVLSATVDTELPAVTPPVVPDATAVAGAEAETEAARLRAQVAELEARLAALRQTQADVDAPIEAGISATLCDEIWVATCSEEEQLARLHATRGMSAEEVRRRRLNQMPEAQMIAAAHRVVPTDGSLVETELLVLRAWLALGLPLPRASVVAAEPNRLLIRIDEDAAVAEGFYRRLGFRRRRDRVFGRRI